MLEAQGKRHGSNLGSLPQQVACGDNSNFPQPSFASDAQAVFYQPGKAALTDAEVAAKTANLPAALIELRVQAETAFVFGID